jgi:hypothetical protein
MPRNGRGRTRHGRSFFAPETCLVPNALLSPTGVVRMLHLQREPCLTTMLHHPECKSRTR